MWVVVNQDYDYVETLWGPFESPEEIIDAWKDCAMEIDKPPKWLLKETTNHDRNPKAKQ